MADTIGSLNPTHQSSSSIFTSTDPNFIFLSPSLNPNLQLSTDFYFIERGPRYNAYARLRESKLRMKRTHIEEDELEIPRSEITPPIKKSVKFRGNFSGSKRDGYSALAQSVPDFSSALRKENRKPAGNMQSATPPAMSKSVKMLGGRGSKSVNSGEKRGGGGRSVVARKSCAGIEELRGVAVVAAAAIAGEKGGRNGGGGGGRNGGRRSVLGYRQL